MKSNVWFYLNDALACFIEELAQTFSVDLKFILKSLCLIKETKIIIDLKVVKVD